MDAARSQQTCGIWIKGLFYRKHRYALASVVFDELQAAMRAGVWAERTSLSQLSVTFQLNVNKLGWVSGIALVRHDAQIKFTSLHREDQMVSYRLLMPVTCLEDPNK